MRDYIPDLQDPLRFNVELAQHTLDYVERFPEQHNQCSVMSRSDCGTVGCIAGWACALVGEKSSGAKAQRLLGMDDRSMMAIFGEPSEEDAKYKLRTYIAVATRVQARHAAVLSAASRKANKVLARHAAAQAEKQAKVDRKAARIEERRQRVIDDEARLQGIGINRRPRRSLSRRVFAEVFGLEKVS